MVDLAPCAEPVGARWTVGAGCIATSISPVGTDVAPTSCNAGTLDAWAWYTGTGASNTITFTPTAGIDVVIHLYEVPNPALCDIFELSCANNGGSGVSEVIVGGGVAGRLYYIRIERVGATALISGCLGITANPVTCNDFIQNGTETGVDCGGGCPAPCPPPTTSATIGCPVTINSTMTPITCDMVGSAFFNAASGTVNYVSQNPVAFPASIPAPCPGDPGGTQNDNGAWALYDPARGVGAATLDINTRTATGSSDIFVSFYQGNSCGTLTSLQCQTLLVKSGNTYILQPVNVSGINHLQNLYVFIYSTNPFSITADLQGYASAPANDNCAAATPASLNGCNLGGLPNSFSPSAPPSNFDPTLCVGGTWFSNENTVFYSFTPTATSATLEIDNITCNNGESGQAQFGVWRTCAAMNQAPTAANGFLGCAVGTAPLSLVGLTIGQTYFIAVDGQAGDICAWNFSTSGIVLLDLELLDFNAMPLDKSVAIDWSTVKDYSIESFTVERSTDAITFQTVTTSSITVNSGSISNYSTQDLNPLPNVSYYRLKHMDTNGLESYSTVKTVSRENIELKGKLFIHNIYPQPFSSILNIDFESGDAEKLSIKIVNNLGQLVFQKTSLAQASQFNRITLDLESLDAGFYTVILEDKITKTSAVERVVKR